MIIDHTAQASPMAQNANRHYSSLNAPSPEGPSFEDILGPKTNRVSDSLRKDFNNLIDEVSKRVPPAPPTAINRFEEPIGMGNADDTVDLLDHFGFLDQVTDSIIKSSGKANWVSESMRFELKEEIGLQLKEMFSGMTWSEVFDFLMHLKLKIMLEALDPFSFEVGEEAPKTIYDELKRTMEKHFEFIRKSL